MLTVEAPGLLFPSLYDGAPKVIVIGCAMACGIAQSERLPVRVLRAILNDAGNLLRFEEPAAALGGGAPHRLLVPPTNVWCVFRGDDVVATGTAELLIAWWREAGEIRGVPEVWTEPPPGFERRLLDRALTELAAAYRRNEALQRSISALRDEWSCAARIPPEIAELLENLRVSPPRMVFASGTPEGVTDLPSTVPQQSRNESPAVLVQPLPAWSRGLLEIDVHLARGVTGDGTLLASLYAIDGDCVLAGWQVPFADLRPGWLPLRLATALDRPFRALELRVSSTGCGSPQLSVAATGLLDEFAMKLLLPQAADGSCCAAAPSRMLAMRIWGGLPGTRWDVSRGAGGHPLWGELAVPIADYIVAQVQASRDFAASFRWFDSLPGGRVLLHPLHNRVAAACIPLPAASALRAVNCEVAMEDHRRRTPIACKLVVAIPETTVDQAESEEQVLASSGWMVLPQPERSYLLSAPLTRPHFGPVNLHLFTRVADGGLDYYGRTVVGRFELRIDSEAAWQMPPVLASCSAGGG
jgi:hypothetical protein